MWKRLTRLLDVTDYPEPLATCSRIRQSIKSAYGDSDRFYHTMRHLEMMYECAVLWGLWTEDPQHDLPLLLSILYHDYVQFSEGAEQKSWVELMKAFPDEDKWFQKYVLPARIPILETAYTIYTEGSTELSQELRDLDLVILATHPNKYKEYRIAVRAEYGYCPDSTYNEGRREFFKEMLKTPIFSPARSPLEEQARKNIKGEIYR